MSCLPDGLKIPDGPEKLSLPLSYMTRKSGGGDDSVVLLSAEFRLPRFSAQWGAQRRTDPSWARQRKRTRSLSRKQLKPVGGKRCVKWKQLITSKVASRIKGLVPQVAASNMTSISETSLSFLTQSVPISGTNIVVAAGIFVVTMAYTIYHTSPMRLTAHLVSAIDEAEKAYLGAIEAGVLSSFDANIELRLSKLQIKVSNIRETSLRNSLSSWLSLGEYFRGRALEILECIGEILKEEQLRDLNPLRVGTATRVVSLRRRHSPSSSVSMSSVQDPSTDRVTLPLTERWRPERSTLDCEGKRELYSSLQSDLPQDPYRLAIRQTGRYDEPLWARAGYPVKRPILFVLWCFPINL
ncbi:hypothetical protein K438DRAFT_1747904 [Mycena galopus ATCC 62051]|nr:hypothetical protein K438DRAFT_1747904 [Mycena galopus ATCC 62051]